ncbi:MAG: hypothetical protein ACKOYM_10555 [Actinomycetes bacterium]
MHQQAPTTTDGHNAEAGSFNDSLQRRRTERGEGVISTAIAVLVIAFLGIALWQGFNGMVSSATTKTRAQVEQIGR